MSKELPYFRFTVAEWLQGDISLEDYKIKGVFIDICSYYWFKDCSITLAMLNKRFKDASDDIDTLLELGIIKTESSDFVIRISYLDDQFDLLSNKRQKRVKAGRLGGLKRSSNAKAKLKQKPSYNDKEKDKEKDKRFKLEILDFKNKYPTQLLEEFFNYWSEPNRTKTKMRFEMEKTWDISRRLSTWEKRSNGFKKEETKGSNLSATPIPENFGVANPNAITRQQYLEEKKLTENK